MAGSLNAFYSVVAVLPMMAIPVLMGGGITLAEFSRMALVTVDALFFSLSIGICVSSMCRSAQKAAALTWLLIVFFTAVLPAGGAVVAALAKTRVVNLLFLAPSVGFSYYLALEGPYQSSKAGFWFSLAMVQGASWLCLVLACLIAPRSWQDRPPGDNPRHWRERWQTWTYGDGVERNALRRRLVALSPILWLIARIRSKPAMAWLGLGLVACAWATGWWKFRREWLYEGVYLSTAVFVNLGLRYWFGSEATRALAENRKTGALELLLSTPLQIEDIFRGQWLALKRQFLGPLIAVLMVECLFMLTTVREAVPGEERVFWLALWTGGMLMLVADLVALYWVGMWQGLTAKNSLRAVGGSLARVLIVPWIGYGLVLLILILVEIGGRSYRSSPSWKFFLGLWFGLGMTVDFAFGAWARQKLLTEFRLAAQQQYGAKREFWRQWFGSLKPHLSGIAPGNWDPGA